MALNVVVLTTGPLITLDEAKLHLRVDADGEDGLISAYIDAATLSVLNYCDLKLVPQGAEPAFKVGALLMLGDLYGSREAVMVGQAVNINPAVGALLRPYRIIRI